MGVSFSTFDNRNEEAAKLLRMIEEMGGGQNDWEVRFLEDVQQWLNDGRSITGKQIFKLRDIKDSLV